MTPERWQRIEALYHAASELPAGDRGRFLSEECRGDQQLYRDVDALLSEQVSGEGIGGLKPVTLASALQSTMPGGMLGGYQLQGWLGSGGMGEVYRATDASLGRDVAIKILPAAFASDPDRLARLEREARTLASLNHVNICAIYGVGDDAGTRFLVLELVEGRTLAEKLARDRLSVADATIIARQIIDALAAAHDGGIVHRDLKPANVKITPVGVVKLLDFGLAKAMRVDSVPGLTHVPAGADAKAGGAILGTAAYMSPEQARGYALDGRTDVWAFGCVLYEMLSGRPAFSGDTDSDTIVSILERDPDWSALPPETPPGVQRLLRRCLVKDPKRRLKDIADARLDLDGVGEPPASTDHNVPAAGTGATPGTLRLLPWLAFVALASGVLVLEARRPRAVENPIDSADFSHITDWEGTESGGVISPDGKFALFVADRDRRFDLFITQIGTGQPLNLTKDGPPLDPQGIVRNFGFTWDGQVWFAPARASGQKGIFTMPVTGGTPRPFLGGDSAGAAWSNDGSRVAYFEFVAGDPIFVVDRSGANPVQILPPVKGRHNHHLVWSTDDQWIYFVSGYLYGLDGADEMDVWRIRPSGGAPQRMTRLNTAATFLTALDPGSWLFVARSPNRAGPWLWWFVEPSDMPRRLISGLAQYTSVSASRDARRIVATSSSTAVNLWRVPLRDPPADESEARRYDVQTLRSSTPRFGADALFYVSTGPAGDGVFRQAHGREPVQIWRGDDGALSEAPAISPDGTQVAVVLRNDGVQQLNVMTAADGTGRHRIATSITVHGAPEWASDGLHLLIGGSNASGSSALFKVPLNDSAPTPIITGDAVNPVLSGDGSIIVYSETIVRGVAPLHAVRLDGTPVPMPPLSARPGSYRFTRTGKTLIYMPTPQSPNFWSFDFDTGRNQAVTRLDDLGRLRMFDISRDGEWIVFDRSRERSDITLITRPR